MTVETILRTKGRWVAMVRPEATVESAVNLMRRERIGSVVVSADEVKVDGIITERDVVLGLAEHGNQLLSMQVGKLVDAAAVSCRPTDSVE